MCLIALGRHPAGAFVGAHHISRVFRVMIPAGPFFGLLIDRRKAADTKQDE